MPEEKFAALKDPSLLLIFAYAPAGLGHLRVTDALYDGLPETANPILLGAQDQSITYLHRITSLSTLGRSLTEWFQKGTQELLFTRVYRWYLKSNTKLIHEQLLTLIDEYFTKPKTILIVATHFGLTHQLAQIIKTIENERQVKIILVVQVTDDSPQRIWYVPGADLTFVPSRKTKEDLEKYAQSEHLPHQQLVVIPYPLSPKLTAKCSDQSRENQLTPVNKAKINLAIPISGAAVGLTYFSQLINYLHSLNPCFHFQITAKTAPFTKNFLAGVKSSQFVNLYTADSDKDVVNLYEKMYLENTISLEITKPSEQAFKALFSPKQIGGSILLFSHPVGRQEYDNLDFLVRHGLIPTNEEHQLLWNLNLNQAMSQKLQQFRGIKIPDDPQKSAEFINWCLNNKVFLEMTKCDFSFIKKDEHPNEIGSDGVSQFWSIVVKYLT